MSRHSISKFPKAVARPQTLTAIAQRNGQCEMHGAFEVSVIRLGRQEINPGCPECQQIRETRNFNEAKEDLERQKREAFQKRLAASGIPPRFIDSRVTNFKTENNEQAKTLDAFRLYLDHLQEMVKQGGNLVLTGTPGTGKTHLACGLLAGAIEAGYNALYVKAFTLLMKIKSGFDYRASSPALEVVQSFIAPDLLVIDEMGLQGSRDLDYSLLFEVIDGRYSNMRPTIVVSNLEMRELYQYLDARLMDRLAQDSILLECKWDSYRERV